MTTFVADIASNYVNTLNLNTSQRIFAYESILRILQYLNKIVYWGNEFFVSLRRIAAKAELNLKTVVKWIRRLIKAKIIKLRVKGQWISRTSNVYFFNPSRVVHTSIINSKQCLQVNKLVLSHQKNKNSLNRGRITWNSEIEGPDPVFSSLNPNIRFNGKMTKFKRNSNSQHIDRTVIDALNKQIKIEPYKIPFHPLFVMVLKQCKHKWDLAVDHFTKHPESLTFIKQPHRSLRPRCRLCNCLCRMRVSKQKFSFGGVFWSCTKKTCRKSYTYTYRSRKYYKDICETPYVWPTLPKITVQQFISLCANEKELRNLCTVRNALVNFTEEELKAHNVPYHLYAENQIKIKEEKRLEAEAKAKEKAYKKTLDYRMHIFPPGIDLNLHCTYYDLTKEFTIEELKAKNVPYHLYAEDQIKLKEERRLEAEAKAKEDAYKKTLDYRLQFFPPGKELDFHCTYYNLAKDFTIEELKAKNVPYHLYVDRKAKKKADAQKQ